MSGKSTYIRAIALLQIMAQVGCFIPAEYASFNIVHNIFTRMSMNDSVEASLSTFSVEMREMAFILRNADSKSMVIIDELGRGTSTRDGLAIAIAIAEALIQSKAATWFATHFIELAQVLADRPGVLNLHLASSCVTSDNGVPHITMLYKAKKGPENDELNYGINLAKAIGLPLKFIQKAEEVSQDLRLKREANQRTSRAAQVLERRQLILSLYDALCQAKSCGHDDALPEYLKKLQKDFILRMAEIDNS
jgi:DNA mismatch repair protein MSH4